MLLRVATVGLWRVEPLPSFLLFDLSFQLLSQFFFPTLSLLSPPLLLFFFSPVPFPAVFLSPHRSSLYLLFLFLFPLFTSTSLYSIPLSTPLKWILTTSKDWHQRFTQSRRRSKSLVLPLWTHNNLALNWGTEKGLAAPTPLCLPENDKWRRRSLWRR